MHARSVCGDRSWGAEQAAGAEHLARTSAVAARHRSFGVEEDMIDIGSRPARILVCVCGCGGPDILRDALPEATFDVVSCTTPEALLECTLQRAPDLILCQLGSIGGDGTNMLRLIRRFLPDTPLVLVSEGTSLEARRLAQDLRPVYFLLAPWDSKELEELVGSFLRSAPAPPAPHGRLVIARESARSGARPVSRKRRISG